MTTLGVPRSGVGWRFWRRQVRDQVPISITIGVTSLLAVLLVSAAPRVLEHASVADVRDALASATPEERNIRFQFDGRLDSRSAAVPFQTLETRSDTLLEQELPESVAAIVADRRWVYDSPTFTVRSFPEQDQGPFPTSFRFRSQQGIDDQLSVVRGRLPGPAPRVKMLAGPDCPSDGTTPDEFAPAEDQVCDAVDVPVFETVITEQTAAAMTVDVRDRVTLTPQGSDSAWRSAPARALGALVVLQISGIVDLTDHTDNYWFADSSLHRPRITENPDFRLIAAVGLLMPQQYPGFLQAVPFVDHRYTWRFVVEPDLVTSADAEGLANDVERISPAGYVTRTRLPEVLGEHIAQRRVTVQLMSTSAAGMFATAIAVIVALALLGAIRERSATDLVMDRGASRTQLRVNAVRTAVAVALLPAIVGWIIAWRSLPATASGPSLRAALTLTVGAMLTVVVWSVPFAPIADSTDNDRRRTVAETGIIIAAVGSVLLLRGRGPVDERAGGDLDLLLISTPALLALAAGVAAARFVGPVGLAGAAVGRRRRNLGWFVGFRRLVAQPPSARTPVVVMTMAVATAVLSSLLSSSVEAGQRTASWQLVGADYRVRSFLDEVPLPIGLDAAAFVGRSTVFGTELINRQVGEGASATTVDLIGIDVAAYRAMLDESGLTDFVLDRFEVGPTTDEALPVVAVGRWPTRAQLEARDRVTVSVDAFRPTIEVLEVVDRFPGLSPGRAALVIDLASLRAATDERLAQPSFVLLDGDSEDLAEIEQVVHERSALARVTSRYERLDAIAGDPFSTWTNRTLLAVAAISLALVLVAAGSAAAISSATRRRDLELLRVLGLRPREARLITAIEHAPSVIASLAVGSAVGAATGALLESTLGLSAFSGAGTDVGLTIDGVALAGLIAAAGFAAAAGIGISQLATVRSEGATMLRVGDP